jgi:hypothetical protein
VMGFPTFEDCAAASGTSLCTPTMSCHLHERIGNAMHVSNVGCVIFAALLSAKFVDAPRVHNLDFNAIKDGLWDPMPQPAASLAADRACSRERQGGGGGRGGRLAQTAASLEVLPDGVKYHKGHKTYYVGMDGTSVRVPFREKDHGGSARMLAVSADAALRLAPSSRNTWHVRSALSISA